MRVRQRRSDALPDAGDDLGPAESHGRREGEHRRDRAGRAARRLRPHASLDSSSIAFVLDPLYSPERLLGKTVANMALKINASIARPFGRAARSIHRQGDTPAPACCCSLTEQHPIIFDLYAPLKSLHAPIAVATLLPPRAPGPVRSPRLAARRRRAVLHEVLLLPQGGRPTRDRRRSRAKRGVARQEPGPSRRSIPSKVRIRVVPMPARACRRDAARPQYSQVCFGFALPQRAPPIHLAKALRRTRDICGRALPPLPFPRRCEGPLGPRYAADCGASRMPRHDPPTARACPEGKSGEASGGLFPGRNNFTRRFHADAGTEISKAFVGLTV